jgi:hypothetical protein
MMDAQPAAPHDNSRECCASSDEYPEIECESSQRNAERAIARESGNEGSECSDPSEAINQQGDDVKREKNSRRPE